MRIAATIAARNRPMAIQRGVSVMNPPFPSLGKRKLRGYRAPLQQELGDLDRVQGRALAQVVADDPEREPLAGGVGPDPSDEHLITACSLAGRRALGDSNPRSACEQLTRAPGRQWLLGLDPDRLRVPDE